MPRPRVVLYNPRAVFYTMPLALVALASALDRDRVDVRDRRRPPRGGPGRRRGRGCRRRALSRRHRAHRRADPRCAGGVARREGGAAALSGRVGRLAPVAVCERVPGRAVDRRRRQRPGRRDVPGDRRRAAVGFAIDGCAGTAVRRRRARSWRRRPVRCATSTSCRARLLARSPSASTSRSRASGSSTTSRRRAAASAARSAPIRRCSRAAGPVSHPERIADEVAALHQSVRHGRARVPGRDVLHARRRGSTRWPTRSCSARSRITWTATLRADQACRLGDDLFAKAVRSGLRRVMVGVESGSQEMLDRLKKDMTIDQVRRTAELCTRHDIGAIFNFIVGFPGESEASIEATLAAGQVAAPVERPRSRRRSSTTGRIPATRSPTSRGARVRVSARPRRVGRLRLRRRPRSVDDAPNAGRPVERFKFYTRHAWKPGAWRWPLRASRAGAATTTGTRCRSRSCWSNGSARRSRCRDGPAARARLLPGRGCRRTARHAAASAAGPAVPVVALEAPGRRRRRLRRHLPDVRGFRADVSNASGRRSWASPST